MPSWRGSTDNPSPNNVRENTDRSEKPIGDNRSLHVRRDTDNQKNITIGLYDIDEAIMTHLERINLQVTDAGKLIKVPVYYGAPEIWTSVRRDGYIRDKQGKIILPVIVLKRTNSGNDESLQYFHRYLKSSVMKKYSTKNKYTKFSLLTDQNVPTNEVYNIVFPSHMKLTYQFIVWTEYVEQMNKIVEDLRFNTKDYWGSRLGFKFRTNIEGFAHTTELQVGEDRIVKTEFDLMVHGYILPETITTLENQKLTIEKFFTPKKFIVNTEVVSTDYDLTQLNTNKEKWRNPNYPNLPKYDDIPTPKPASPIVLRIVESLKTIYSSSNTGVSWHLPAPTASTDYGEEGWLSYDINYYYIYTSGSWKRVPISLFTNAGTTF